MNSISPAPSGQVDLTNCDREPIHLLGYIQDVGLLIAVSRDWLIERVSGNIGRFVDRLCRDLDLPPEAAGARAVRKPFADDILLVAVSQALARSAARSSPAV